MSRKRDRTRAARAAAAPPARPTTPPRARPAAAPVAPPGAPRWPLVVVLAVALAIRLAYLACDRDSPFFAPTLLDSAYYHGWARRILEGDLATAGVFYGLPLYPYFLAAVYAVTATSVVAVKVVQILLGLATIVFVARIGETLADRATGLVAAALAAVYGPLFFHETMLVPEALGIPLYAAAFLLVCRFLARPTVRRGALAGAVLGLACLTKAGALTFVLLFTATLLVRPGLAGGVPRRATAALALACVAVLVPVTVHNLVWGHDLVLLTSHGGVNFYIGNNPDADGTFQAPPGTGIGLEEQIADSRAVAEQAAGRSLAPSEVSAYWSGRARAFIREHPLAFLRLALRKLVLAVDARELSDLQGYDTAGQLNALMRLPWPSFAVVGPLALAALVLGRVTARYRWVLGLWLGSYVAGLLTFFVNARYRLPMVPVLLALAALALRELALLARAREWPRLAACVVVLLLATGLTQLALVPTDPARDLANAASLRMRAGDYAAARALYERALAVDPEHARANLGMGIVLALLGEPDESGAYYLRSVASSPDPLAYNNLGSWYLQRGELDAAEEALRRAVELKPHLANAHNNLGIVHARRGDFEKAVEEHRTALALDPRSCKAETNLGTALRQLGRAGEARDHWVHALAIDPTCASAARALALPSATESAPSSGGSVRP